MNNEEFKTYVNDQRRIGLNDSQIARNLGMDVGIFKDAVKHAFDVAKREESVAEKEIKIVAEVIEEKPKAPRKPRKKAEVFEVPQGE